MSVLNVIDLYAALRTVITNLPERYVEKVVIRCGMDEVPTAEVTMALVGSDGEILTEPMEGLGVDGTAPMDTGVMHFVRDAKIKRETRKFHIVPLED